MNKHLLAGDTQKHGIVARDDEMQANKNTHSKTDVTTNSFLSNKLKLIICILSHDVMGEVAVIIVTSLSNFSFKSKRYSM